MTPKTKNILFLVTGMTPAIITETIWALACDPKLDESERWIPDEVHVLSTEHGLNQIRSKLLQGHVIEQLKRDFPHLAAMQLSDAHMHSIKGSDKHALLDLRTPEDNECAADEIHERIRALTQNEQVCLHVSIAGGRKTMGFYAGYALSLHGRAQDRMSHVLVDERFESIPDFFYPTPHTRFVTDREGRSWDAHTAQVWLAEIPFVRMKEAIKEHHQLRTGSFTDTVRKINEASNDIHLQIHVRNKTLVVNEQFEVSDLPPKEFAFFCLFAHNRQQGKEGFIAPRHNTSQKEISAEDMHYIGLLSEQFRYFYDQLRDEMYLEDRHVDVGRTYFESTKSMLNKYLGQALGLELAAKLAIKSDKRGQPFYLDVAPEAIQFI